MSNWENRAKKLEGKAKQRRHKIHNKGMANSYKNMVEKKNSILNKIDTLNKDFGMAADVNVPTAGGGKSSKKQIQQRIDNILGKSMSTVHAEAKQAVPKTKTQKKILGTIEHFLEKNLVAEQLIQKFLEGYKELALLSKSFDGEKLQNLVSDANEVNVYKNFGLSLQGNSDRVDKVIFIDSVAHNLHKQKLDDGSSIYHQLDELASISKSIGEKNRDDRLLLLQSPVDNINKLESLDIQVLHKGSSLPLWGLYNKAIKVGIENLSTRELVLLREFLWTTF